MKNKLSKPERELLKSYRKGEWKSRGKKALKEYTAAAKRQIKEERINIRLAKETLERIRVEAVGFGIPYQTLIASILHRYAHDKFYDERHILKAFRIFKG